MNTPSARDLPDYRDLPVRPGAPPGSSWGVWGEDDQLGALNLLTDERTLAAADEVRKGAVFPLGLALDAPSPVAPWRTPARHYLLRVGHQAHGNLPTDADETPSRFADRDDYLDGLWLQGSSQWDGLAHVRHREYGNYNGVPDADIHPGEGGRLGVDNWAARGIVGRGVVLDLPGYYAAREMAYDVRAAHAITVDDLRGALMWQRAQIQVGDIALIYTGWLQYYLDTDPEQRHLLTDASTMTVPGLEASPAMAQYLWDLHIAAVASDTIAVEVLGPGSTYYLHSQLLPLLGIALGELFQCRDLVADCAADGRYTFLFVSVPFNVHGGIGSPPQAVAIK